MQVEIPKNIGELITWMVSRLSEEDRQQLDACIGEVRAVLKKHDDTWAWAALWLLLIEHGKLKSFEKTEDFTVHTETRVTR